MKELFIISSQRSGSNWLHRCLAFHSSILINGELYPSRTLNMFDRLKTGDSVSYNSLKKKNVFKEIAVLSVQRMMSANIDKDDNNTTIGDNGYLADKSAYSCLKSLKKEPEQFEYLKILQKYFPNSKKILLIRDVRDVIVSYSKWDNGSINLLKCTPISVLYFIRHMSNWYKLHEKWLQDAKGDNNTLIIYYSDMKSAFHNTIEEVFSFLELKVEDNFLNKMYEKYYSIKSKTYEEENIKRGYSFYRKGIIGEWEKEFKWFHKIITSSLYTKGINRILLEISK